MTFAQPIQSTSDLPQPLAVEQEFSLTRPSTKGLPQDRTYTALPSVNLELNKQALQLIIDNECDKLCSPNSIFRRTSTDLKEDFSWQAYEEELKKTAPTLWLVLDTASSSLGTTYIRKRTTLMAASMVAAAVLLNERNSHVCGLQLLLSLVLWHGHASTMVSLSF